MLAACAELPDITHVQQSASPLILTEIYQPTVNLAIWQRSMPDALASYSRYLTEHHKALQIRTVLAATQVTDMLNHELPEQVARAVFVADVQQLTDMYADLFDLTHVGIRLSVLNTTLCPRFHTDRLMCRLVSTYHGAASQWLSETCVDRTKLGAGAKGLPDHASGIYTDAQGIWQLSTGDVALLKGDAWQDGHLNGIVHRSPVLNSRGKRLLLTLDFANE